MNVCKLAADLILFVWYLGIAYLGILVAIKILCPGHQNSIVTGFGRRIASFSIGTTRFEWRLIPFVPRLCYSSENRHSIWREFGALLGGPIALFIMGVLVVVAVLVTGIWVPSRPGAEITEVKGFQIDLREKDIVLEANGRTIVDGAGLALELNDRKKKDIFLVERDGSNVRVEIDRENEASTELTFQTATGGEYPGIWKAIGMVPQTLWDILALKWRYKVTSDSRLFMYRGFEIGVVSNLLDWFWMGLTVCLFLLLISAVAIGYIMVQSQLRPLAFCIICVIVGSVLLIPSAIYFPTNKLVESDFMPVNVSWVGEI